MSESSSQSGEHLLGLEAPMSRQTPTGPIRQIDPDRLLNAWKANVQSQLELIRVVEKNEDHNRATRYLVTWGAAAFALLNIGFGFGMAWHATTTAARLESRIVAAEKSTTETLRAVRASSKALGAKVEADAMLTPQSEEKARKAGVEAQKAALEAEVKVGKDPKDRAAAQKALNELELDAGKLDKLEQ